MSKSPPVREMVRQAAQTLEEPFSNAEIREFVLARWPETNEDTIQCHIVICTVNQQSRINWPENHRPRVAGDPRYDFLYRLGRGRRVLYDPDIHGRWRIARTPKGDLVVAGDDEMPALEKPPETVTARPISQSQIDAANRLHRYLPTWAATEKGFERLRNDLPAFDLPAVLMKSAAVNDLYSTRVYRIWRMALHITQVISELPDDPVGAVLTIGRLPGGGGQTHRSFASKFCHFFIDPDRFPIYDSYCEQMVRHHLGKTEAMSNSCEPYRAFKANIDRLRKLSRIDASYRELDRYLWLVGQYRDWLENGEDAQINTELRELFEDPCPEAADALGVLVSDAASQRAEA